jgi:hypothetical protein
LNFEPKSRPYVTADAHSWVLPAILVAMNLGSSIALFDGYIVQNLPYEEHIDDVMQILK